MIVCSSKDEIRSLISKWRGEGETVGAVLTMGALHRGHLSLIDAAKRECDRVVVTVFVNPLQFGPNEDFDAYPRDLSRDQELLKAQGCDAVFAPVRDELFASDFSTKVSVGGVRENHCAVTRPQFFDGVATIVAKLLMVLSPDAAVFGEKDYQQLQVVKRLVRDLDMPVKIIGAPIVRETDGLAMSSRNEYLSPAERAIAPALYETLNLAPEKIADPNASWAPVRDWATARLIEAGFSKVDYVNLADAQTLALLEHADRPARLLAAAWIGKTRLIDNIAVGVRRS